MSRQFVGGNADGVIRDFTGQSPSVLLMCAFLTWKVEKGSATVIRMSHKSESGDIC